MVAISTGGGMIEVIEIDGHKVRLFGDYDVTLIEVDGDGTTAKQRLHDWADQVHVIGNDPALVIVNAQTFVDEQMLRSLPSVLRVRQMAAVLPVRSSKGLTVPFLHASEMLAAGDPANRKLSDFALDYETASGGIAEADVFEQMRKIHRIVKNGIAIGLAGTEYEDRILPRQSHRFA